MAVRLPFRILTQDAWSGVGHVRMKMGADGGRAVREVFYRAKPMMLSRLVSWFPRHIVPCTSGRWCRGNFRRKPMAIPLVDLRLGHNLLCSIAKRGAWTGAAYQPAKRCPILETGLRVGGPGSAHAFEQTKPNLLILHNLDPETPEYVDLSALRAREHPLTQLYRAVKSGPGRHGLVRRESALLSGRKKSRWGVITRFIDHWC